MVHDLLPVDKDVYEYEFKDASNQKRCKKVILGEQDSLWPGVRHLFISDAILSVTQGFKEFVSKSKAGNLSKGTVSVQELSEALKAMPQHQEKMQRYQLHIHIAEKCMECLKRMEPIVIVEQNMVMGATADGSKVTHIVFVCAYVYVCMYVCVLIRAMRVIYTLLLTETDFFSLRVSLWLLLGQEHIICELHCADPSRPNGLNRGQIASGDDLLNQRRVCQREFARSSTGPRAHSPE